jgi:hypothetical protein
MSTTTQWIDLWAETKAGHSPGMLFPWRRALMALRQTGLNDAQCDLAAEHATTSGSLFGLAYILMHSSHHTGHAEQWELLVNTVEESDHSLGDWLECLEVMAAWLKTKGHHSNLTNICQYLECCSAATASSNTHTRLARNTEEMLEQYGFDSATRD